MDPVLYRILGTTQALRPDGTPVPIGGARLRALLTVLALRPGRTVPAAVLVDEVWDGDPPADAPGALQALVGRLRRAIGPDAVESVDGGYRLAALADAVDLHRFERLAGEGTRALADGDPAKAAAVLDDALTLWHGPVLADLPDRTAESARWGRVASMSAAPASPRPWHSATPNRPCPSSPPCATSTPWTSPSTPSASAPSAPPAAPPRPSPPTSPYASSWPTAWARTPVPNSAPCTGSC